MTANLQCLQDEIMIIGGLLSGEPIEEFNKELLITKNAKDLYDLIKVVKNESYNDLVLAVGNKISYNYAKTDLTITYLTDCFNSYLNRDSHEQAIKNLSEYNQINAIKILGLELQTNPDKLAINEIKDKLDKINKFNHNVSNCAYETLLNIQSKPIQEPIPLPFDILNKLLDGGLYPGLYVVGAVPSLGKSTFVQIIADSIAALGKKVLFNNIEMSKESLVARSISRIASSKGDVITSRDILKGNVKIEKLLKNKDFANEIKSLKNIFYDDGSDGGFSTTIDSIIRNAYSFTNKYGEAPVIIIDYLQIIATTKNLTDKAKNDEHISALKKLSRKLNTPIIVISSISRNYYYKFLDYSAFKESGGIEYSADTIIALQYKHVSSNEKEDIIRQKCIEEKAKDVREIDAVILKNRDGAGGHVSFNYFAKINKYVEKHELLKTATKRVVNNDNLTPKSIEIEVKDKSKKRKVSNVIKEKNSKKSRNKQEDDENVMII